MRGVLNFFIPASATLKWSHLFGVMEMAKQQFPIEDYSISQTSLEQVFLSFCRQQRKDWLAFMRNKREKNSFKDNRLTMNECVVSGSVREMYFLLVC